MICPRCHAEFREGFTTCSDCEVDLVEDLDSVAAPGADGGEGEWAGGAFGGIGAGSGDPGDLVPLVELGSPEMLGTLLEQLEETQVPYVVQAGTALALTQGRDLEAAGSPDPWQARVMVVASFRPQARAMVDEIVAEAKREALAARTAALPGISG